MRPTMILTAVLVVVLGLVLVRGGPGSMVATGTSGIVEGWNFDRECFVQLTLERTTSDPQGQQTTVKTPITMLSRDVRIRIPWLQTTHVADGILLESYDGTSHKLPLDARTVWVGRDGSWHHDTRALPDLTALSKDLRQQPELELIPELRRRAPGLEALIDRIGAEMGTP